MKNFFHKIKEKLYTCKLRELKVLFILGILCLLHIIIKIFVNDSELDPVDVVIRSQLIYIFSYLFSTKLKTKTKYYSRDFQFSIATIVSFLCLITLMISHWIGTTKSIQSLSSVRDIMVSSIGFIMGQSKE